MDLSNYPDIDNEVAIKQAIARAAALRQQTTQPQGQMVGNVGFQHYVAPHWSQNLSPVLNQVLARGEDTSAVGLAQRQKQAQAKALQDFLASRPQGQAAVPGVEGTPGSAGVPPFDLNTGERLQGPPVDAAAPVAAVPPKAAVPPTAEETGNWALGGLNVPGTTGDVAKQIAIDAFTKKPKEQMEQDAKLAKLQSEQTIQKIKGMTAIQKQQLANLSTDKRTDALMALGMDRNEATRYASDNTLYGAITRGQLQYDASMAGVDQRRDAANARAAALASNGTLSSTTAGKMSEALGSLDQQKQLLETFDPTTMTGPYNNAYAAVNRNWFGDKLTNFLGETFGMNPDKGREATNWWQTFKSFDNIERHKLFGSALTETEAKLWATTTVSPHDSADTIRKAIETRRDLADKAMQRLTALSTMPKAQAVAWAQQQGLTKYDASGHNASVAAPAPMATAPTGAGAPAAPSQDGWVDAGGGLRYRVKP